MFNPGCSQPSTMDHLENIVSTNYKEMHNNIQSLVPPNDDEDELFSSDDIIVDNDGFEHFHECLAPKSKEVPHNETGFTSFTMSQKCLTSLMILLDSLECPDYAFEKY